MDVFVVLLIVGIAVFLVYSERKDKEKKAARDSARQEQINGIREGQTAELHGSEVHIHADGGVNEKLRMAQVKCVQCGASIEPGTKFCKFCGTQVPDDAFRAEIVIDDKAQIEAVKQQAKIDKIKAQTQKILAESEANKAKAEAEQIRLKNKELLKAERGKKARRIGGLICLGIVAVLAVVSLAGGADVRSTVVIYVVPLLVLGIVLLVSSLFSL